MLFDFLYLSFYTKEKCSFHGLYIQTSTTLVIRVYLDFFKREKTMFGWEGGRWLLKRSRPTFNGSQVRQWSCPYFEVRGEGVGGFGDMSFPDSLERAEKWFHAQSQNKWHRIPSNPPSIYLCAFYPINSSAILLIVKSPEYFKDNNILRAHSHPLFCHL